jgi:hypothetical protein
MENYEPVADVVLDPDIPPTVIRREELADSTIFSSTTAPPQSDLIFAFGTSVGVIQTSVRNLQDRDFSISRNLNVGKDVLALEFLSETPSVLLSGNRRGILHISDLRDPTSHPTDTVTHPSSISHIKQLDRHRIIVAGLNSTLCQYDLRFRKISHRSRGSRLKSLDNKSATVPCLEYPDHYNTATTSLAFDVDLESRMVVAGQERAGGAALRWFSLHGGHEVNLHLDPNILRIHLRRDYANSECYGRYPLVILSKKIANIG